MKATLRKKRGFDIGTLKNWSNLVSRAALSQALPPSSAGVMVWAAAKRAASGLPTLGSALKLAGGLFVLDVLRVNLQDCVDRETFEVEKA